MPPVKSLFIIIALGLTLAACAKNSSQNVYQERDVGKSAVLNYATVLSSRPIDIVGRRTGAGGALGAAVGGGAGSAFGSGSGSAVGVGVGLVAGAIIGAAIEQNAADRKGIEYTIQLDHGVLMTVAQEVVDGESQFQAGDRVVMQTSGGYQRLLPVSN